jgi:hypothetical protein
MAAFQEARGHTARTTTSTPFSALSNPIVSATHVAKVVVSSVVVLQYARQYQSTTMYSSTHQPSLSQTRITQTSKSPTRILPSPTPPPPSLQTPKKTGNSQFSKNPIESRTSTTRNSKDNPLRPSTHIVHLVCLSLFHYISSLVGC